MPTLRRGAGLDRLPSGLYEDVITDALETHLTQLEPGEVERAKLEPDDALEALTQLVSQATRLALDTLRGKDAVQDRVRVAARVLETLREAAPEVFRPGETSPQDALLLSISRKGPLGLIPDKPARPATALTRSDLFTNSERHSVVQELASEIASADRIDLLCAFIKWSGFIKFRDALTAHCRAGRPLRVLTTTYLGATDARAVEELRALGAEVRVSYEETPTRLHAKAWLFHRNTGLSTAYIGSSNLSRAALTDGLEWNVRVAATELPRVIEKFEGVFRRYWEDPDAGFVSFTGSDEDRQRLRDALSRARFSTRGGGAQTGSGGAGHDPALRVLDVHPHDYQRRMLEDLEVARAQGRTRNLVVAATGTGKTVLAALDYRRLRESQRAETLLFVVHRDTILQQARETFRAALKDPHFGELWVGGDRPQHGRHVFASVQSLAAAFDRGEPPAPDAFDLVIVDEVHHAPAQSYAQLLGHLAPKLLLGLTATPERMDDQPGHSLRLETFFDRPWASELRLWEAIDRQILVPFNYFAIDDGTDLSGAWKRGRYVASELSNLYSADHIWLDRVARAVARTVRAPQEMRALAFCVDVRHAELTARLLSERLGLRAEPITSATPHERRHALLRDFASSREERPRILCTVDLFNEGVDIPSVDTLLLLRPTESATLFIQQLGRGLRRAFGKDALTVLDFVGIQHDAFRFDLRYENLLGTSRGELHRALKANVFPHLPSGCSFHLEERPRKQIIAALQRSLGVSLNGLAARLSPVEDEETRLDVWLSREQLELPEVYKDKRTWSDVRQHSGFEVPGVSSGEEKAALENLQRLVHVDDGERIEALRELATGRARPGEDERSRRILRMLGGVLFGFEAGTDAGRVAALIAQMPRLRWELDQLVEALAQRSRVLPRPRSPHIADEVPLHLHAHYLTEEIAAAFDLRTKEGLLYRPQSGVISVGDRHDLLLVTLDKKSKSKVPHLQYEDYALSPRLFHWESQASTRRDDKLGRRHLGDTVRPLLFIREINKDDRGLGVSYRYIGAVRRVDDEGERPIRITWSLLEADLPPDLLQQSRAAVA